MRRDLNLEILCLNVVSKQFVLSSPAECFAFNKTSFHTQRMARGIMCILKGFREKACNVYGCQGSIHF